MSRTYVLSGGDARLLLGVVAVVLVSAVLQLGCQEVVRDIGIT